MLSKDDIQHIADLVRIDVTDKEKEEFSENLSSVLNYVSQLKEVESGVSEEALKGDFKLNVLRSDERYDDNLEGAGDELVDMAPSKKNGYVKVKKVL